MGGENLFVVMVEEIWVMLCFGLLCLFSGVLGEFWAEIWSELMLFLLLVV